MIIFYHKDTGKVLGTQDMMFIDTGVNMKWDDIPDNKIGKKVIGGQGEIVEENGNKYLKIVRDEYWKLIKAHEDTDGGDSLLNYKLEESSDTGFDTEGKKLFVEKM